MRKVMVKERPLGSFLSVGALPGWSLALRKPDVRVARDRGEAATSGTSAALRTPCIGVAQSLMSQDFGRMREKLVQRQRGVTTSNPVATGHAGANNCQNCRCLICSSILFWQQDT